MNLNSTTINSIRTAIAWAESQAVIVYRSGRRRVFSPEWLAEWAWEARQVGEDVGLYEADGQTYLVLSDYTEGQPEETIVGEIIEEIIPHEDPYDTMDGAVLVCSDEGVEVTWGEYSEDDIPF